MKRKTITGWIPGHWQASQAMVWDATLMGKKLWVSVWKREHSVTVTGNKYKRRRKVRVTIEEVEG